MRSSRRIVSARHASARRLRGSPAGPSSRPAPPGADPQPQQQARPPSVSSNHDPSELEPIPPNGGGGDGYSYADSEPPTTGSLAAGRGAVGRSNGVIRSDSLDLDERHSDTGVGHGHNEFAHFYSGSPRGHSGREDSVSSAPGGTDGGRPQHRSQYSQHSQFSENSQHSQYHDAHDPDTFDHHHHHRQERSSRPGSVSSIAALAAASGLAVMADTGLEEEFADEVQQLLLSPSPSFSAPSAASSGLAASPKPANGVGVTPGTGANAGVGTGGVTTSNAHSNSNAAPGPVSSVAIGPGAAHTAKASLPASPGGPDINNNQGAATTATAAAPEESFLAQAQRLIDQSQDQADRELQEQRRQRRARERELRLQRLRREREKLAKQVLTEDAAQHGQLQPPPSAGALGVAKGKDAAASTAPWMAAASAYAPVPGRLHLHSQAASQLLARQNEEANSSLLGSCFGGLLTSLCGAGWSIPGLHSSWNYDPLPEE